MTDRISHFESSPATTFVVEADVVGTDPNFGDHGRWRIRAYLRANNGPGGSTGSSYNGSGTQAFRRSGGSNLGSHVGNPFLPGGYANGAQRWRDVFEFYVNANSNGYQSGSSTSYPLEQHLAYGSVADVSTGSLPIPRIARAPGAPAEATAHSITTTSATLLWGAAARGNANIIRYEWQIATTSNFASPIGGTRNAGNNLTDSVTGLTPATLYYVRVRAVNGDGTGAWSTTRSFTTTPAAPTTPTVSALTTTSMTLSWTDVNGPAVTGYDLQYSTSPTFASGVTTISLGDVLTRNVTGLTPGTTYYWRVRAKADSVSSGWSGTRTQATNPAAPGTPSVGTVTTTSIALSWTNGGNGNAITGYDLQRATSPDFSGATTIALGNVLSHNVTGLTPGTTYYFRVRAKTASASSNWSGTRSQTTLPATPPGMVVTPALSGASATVTLTPPGGVTGVTLYNVEYRRLPSGPTVARTTATTTLNVTGLTPGATYEWRANAEIGSYTSPWTAWVPIVQPNPNTNPGDYFDGSTAARPDTTFSWTGTTNNSTSRANGVGVLGWQLAGAINGGTAVLQRVTGGLFGDYSARMIMLTDAAGAGVRVGQQNATGFASEVAEGGVYVGSMYVNPIRTQRMVAELTWVDAGFVLVDRTLGEETVVEPSAEMTRLQVTGEAPPTAAWGLVRVIDVAGDDHSPWLSGETLDLDGAMITIGSQYPWFSGDTPDTAQFEYDWLGTPNNSVSTRTTLDVSEGDPLADPDCPAPPQPPQPPALVDDCIVEVGTWRRYWVQVPAEQIALWIATVPTFTLTTGPESAGQVRIRVYPNPDGVPPSDFNASQWESEQIVRYIPPNTTFVIDGVSQRARASVDGGDWLPADHLLYGTGGAPATWPVMQCGSPYLISFDVPLDADIGNFVADLALTNRML